MIFDRNENREVIALLGAGSMGTAIVRSLPFIKETALQRSGIAYMIAKRVNHLQAQKAAATTWKERRARINTIRTGQYKLH